MKIILLLGICGLLATQAFAGSQHGSHWGYAGKQGPEHWSSLSADYAVCAAGTRQSPIDIDSEQLLKAELTPLKFNYQAKPSKLLNNGHTIQLNYQPGSYLDVAGQQYELLQLHFHSPSENTVGGKPFDMEMHLVHKNKQGKLAVVGIFIKQGEENNALKSLWKNMPLHAGDKVPLQDAALNAAQLLPKAQAYSHFKGSLTTPPCSEGVNWFVMQEPIEVSTKQLSKFLAVIGENARPVQKLNNRFVLANSK